MLAERHTHSQQDRGPLDCDFQCLKIREAGGNRIEYADFEISELL